MKVGAECSGKAEMEDVQVRFCLYCRAVVIPFVTEAKLRERQMVCWLIRSEAPSAMPRPSAAQDREREESVRPLMSMAGLTRETLL